MWLVNVLIYILLLLIWITVDIILMEYDYFEVWGIEIGYKKNGAYIPLRSPRDGKIYSAVSK